MKAALSLSISVFVFVLFPLVTSAEQLEFKGIPMGATEAVVQQKFPSAECNRNMNEVIADRSCTVSTESFAGIYNSVYFVLNFYADKLQQITVTLKPDDYDRAIEALIAKYGAPSKVKTQKLQNRMGAAFINHIKLWKFKDGTITALRYLIDADTSVIIYATYFYEQEYTRRSHKDREKSKKDL